MGDSLGNGANDWQCLRILIANERLDRLELLAQTVIGLGHNVIAREISVREVGVVTARDKPDVALVGLGQSSEHALELIGEIVREASCPVIALLYANDPTYIREAARRGVFAYIIEGTPEELQSAIEITLCRFTEYNNLQSAFGRRATIEQAKGILMARNSIGAEAAFATLRDHSQHNGRPLIEVAAAIVESHLLLFPTPTAEQAGALPPLTLSPLVGVPLVPESEDASIAAWQGDLGARHGSQIGRL
jgi:AmiR/NasT family two-component response regulator